MRGLGRGGDQPPNEARGKEGLIQRSDHRPEDVPLGGQRPDSDLEGREHAPLVGRVVGGAHRESPELRGDLPMGVAEHGDHRGEAGGDERLRGGTDQGPAGAVRVGEEGLGAAHPLRLAGGEEDPGGCRGTFPGRRQRVGRGNGGRS